MSSLEEQNKYLLAENKKLRAKITKDDTYVRSLELEVQATSEMKIKYLAEIDELTI